MGALAVAAALRLRSDRAPAPAPAGGAAALRSQLRLDPVLPAEEAVARRPDDLQARQALEQACRDADDPVGAALALYPLAERAPVRVELVEQCLAAGWLEEAAEIVRRDPAAPAFARIALADAYAARADAGHAVPLLAALKPGSLPAEAQAQVAAVWYRLRRRAEALRWARAAAAGGAPPPHAALATCLLAQGQPGAALQAIGEAADPALDYLRAQAELRSAKPNHRTDGARRMLQLAARGDNPGAAFEAGRFLVQDGRAKDAIPFLARAGDGGYQTVLCYEWLARAYTALGSPADADWAESRALAERDQRPEAIAAVRRSLRHDPRKEIALEDLANLLKRQAKFREALAQAEQALAVRPDATVGLLRADLLGRLARSEEQARMLEAVAAEHPESAVHALRALGDLHFGLARYAAAEAAYERALRAAPDDSESHRQLGACYARTIEEPGAADQALFHLARAAGSNPADDQAWMLLGPVLQRIGRQGEAAACYRRAIIAGKRREMPYLYLARSLERQGRRAEAEWVLRRYRRVRAETVREMELDREAEFHPRDAARRFAWGDFLLHRGQPLEALPELLAATALKPDRKEPQTRLADACALLGFDDMMQEAERAAR